MNNPRKVMLAALAVLFVSQFMTYSTSNVYGYVTPTDGWRGTHAVWHYENNPEGTGWEIHRHAMLIIPLLAYVYLSSFWKKDFWRRWGYLISLVLIFACLTPGEWTEYGFKLGLAAFGLAIWATVLNRRDRKSAQQFPGVNAG